MSSRNLRGNGRRKPPQLWSWAAWRYPCLVGVAYAVLIYSVPPPLGPLLGMSVLSGSCLFVVVRAVLDWWRDARDSRR